MELGTSDGAPPGAPSMLDRTGRSRRVEGLPRAHPALLVVAGACAALFHHVMHAGLSGDVYFHLAAGRWMLAHGAVIRQDVFSYTARGRSWVADEWGFEYALAWLVRTIGPVSYWLVSAGSCSLALLFGVARWRRLGAGWLWTAALACFATAGLEVGLGVRPQDPSYAFFALELLLLTLARRDERWLVALPALLLLWANVHGSFLLGLGVLLLELLWSLLPARQGRLVVGKALRSRSAAAVAVASAVATFVNPRGPALVAYTLHVSTSTELTSLVQEWQSPDFHDVLVLALVVVPVLWVVGALAISDRALALDDTVLAFGLLLGTLHAVRFLPYLALASCSMLAKASPLPRESLRPSLLSLPLAAALVAGVVVSPHLPAGTPARGDSPLDVPVDAATFLHAQTGRVFSTYWWGDYLLAVGIPVFVDGRTDLYFGTGVLETYVDVSTVAVDPDPVFRRYDVRWILWNRGSALATYLEQDPRWDVVIRSGDAVVFRHVGRW